MGVLDYFKPVGTWTAQQVREFLKERADGSYNLVDVRQPQEYERGHLPGAVLIPVAELDQRVSELDADKVTIVYCAAGVRSRAAASMLQRAGFAEVYSMTGGLNAWSGAVAEGWPEAGMTWFAAADSIEEMAALAWVLEDGSVTFYERLMEKVGDPDAAALFRELLIAEEGHKETLAALLPKITGTAGKVDFPALLGGYPAERIMEGGMRVDEALAWAEDKGVKEILELALSLETGSYDRYQTLSRKEGDQKRSQLFRALAAEEKRHLVLLTGLFEKHL